MEVGLNCFSVVDSELFPKLLHGYEQQILKAGGKCIAELQA